MRRLVFFTIIGAQRGICVLECTFKQYRGFYVAEAISRSLFQGRDCDTACGIAAGVPAKSIRDSEYMVPSNHTGKARVLIALPSPPLTHRRVPKPQLSPHLFCTTQLSGCLIEYPFGVREDSFHDYAGEIPFARTHSIAYSYSRAVIGRCNAASTGLLPPSATFHAGRYWAMTFT